MLSILTAESKFPEICNWIRVEFFKSQVILIACFNVGFTHTGVIRRVCEFCDS
jgi:hypothetical protein